MAAVEAVRILGVKVRRQCTAQASHQCRIVHALEHLVHASLVQLKRRQLMEWYDRIGFQLVFLFFVLRFLFFFLVRFLLCRIGVLVVMQGPLLIAITTGQISKR